jgi:hypothetical protein
MSWKMGAPPPPPPLPLGIKPIPLAEQRADLLQDHAINNLYTGPFIPGDMFAGWPLDELVKRVLPTVHPYEQMDAIVALKMRHNMTGGLGASSRPPSRPYTHEERLAMRMQWGRVEDSNWAPGFKHVALHSANGSVHVWVITKQGQSIVLEDEASLFPSDALVTKLSILKE